MRYPDMPLSQVLNAEKKFVEADINRDGVSLTSICKQVIFAEQQYQESPVLCLRTDLVFTCLSFCMYIGVISQLPHPPS